MTHRSTRCLLSAYSDTNFAKSAFAKLNSFKRLSRNLNNSEYKQNSEGQVVSGHYSACDRVGSQKTDPRTYPWARRMICHRLVRRATCQCDTSQARGTNHLWFNIVLYSVVQVKIPQQKVTGKFSSLVKSFLRYSYSFFTSFNHLLSQDVTVNYVPVLWHTLLCHIFQYEHNSTQCQLNYL